MPGFAARLVRVITIAPSIALVLACSGRTADEGESVADGESVAGTDDTSRTASDSSSDTGGTSDGCEPILQDDGTPTGYETCMPDDSVVRTGSVTCTDPTPPSQGSTCSAGYGECASDDDCTAAPYGACGYIVDVTAACRCEYGCMTDADCGAGQVCMCAPLHDGTRCVDADCSTDADCDPGYRCTLSLGVGLDLRWPSVRCHSAADECQSDADCPDGLCLWHGARWECED